MTTIELARHVMLSERTIRRYARNGILKPSRRTMGAYKFHAADIDAALIARDRKQRQLELVSPGLARFQQRRRQRRLGGLRTQGTNQLNDDRGPIQMARCPRCGHLHSPSR